MLPSTNNPEVLTEDGLVTLTQAAEELDVHYMTAYRYVRTGRMVAEKRGGKWWVAPSDLAAVVAEGTGARRRPAASSEPRDFRVEPFTKRLTAGDTAGCWDLISDSLSSGAEPAEIYRCLIGPALESVGERWHRGDLSVADEHRATATAYRLVGQMGPLFRHRGRRRGTVVLGSVSGDMHGMPTALMSDLLSDRRFEVIDLGANTPTQSFVESAAATDHFLGFGLCVAFDERIDMALTQVAELREALPDSYIVIGGPAVAMSPRRDEFAAFVDLVSSSADDVCDAFEQLVEDA